MKFPLFIIFISSFLSFSASSQIQDFEGLTFTNTKGSYELLPVDNEQSHITIKQGDKIIYLPEAEARSLAGYQAGNVYFKISSSSPGKKRTGEYFKLPMKSFQSQVYKGQYSNFVRQKFMEKRIPYIKKGLKRFEGKNFDVSTNFVPLNYQGFMLKIKEGEKLHVVKESDLKNIPNYDPNNIYFQRFDSSTGKIIKGDYYSMSANSFENEVHKGSFNNWVKKEYEKISPINYLDNTPIKTVVKTKPKVKPKPKPKTKPKNQDVYRSEPTPKGTVETVNEVTKILNEEFNSPMIECPDFEGKLKKNYEQCSPENDYIQSTLKGLLNQEDLRSSAAGKFCILAGLNKEISFKVARCSDDKKLLGKRVQVCKSNEYVSFVHKELKQMSNCFTNIHYKEILPLVNAESQFNYNAYNLNSWGEYKGQLNASGILQTTQVLVDGANRGKAYLLDNGDKELFSMKYNYKNKYCNAIMTEVKNNPPTKSRNVCKRTMIPNGFRKSLYLAMANYSFYKQSVQKELDATSEAYFPGKELFSPHEKEKFLVDLTRLMHSRGIGVFKKRMRSFFYDLFHGKFGQEKTKKIKIGKIRIEDKKNGKTQYDENGVTITKVVKGSSTVKHGNASLFKLWGRPGFKAPISHEAFISHFSSYIFWEGKYQKNKQGSRGRKFEPSDTNRDSEGGTYLHKMACDQKLLNQRAKRLAKNSNVDCGYPKISPNRMEHTQVEAGWYLNVCKKNNKSSHSRRTCMAKDPYKAKDSNGKRRLTNKSIKSYTEDESLLEQCDHESLHGMASRPLIEFYAPTPGNYK